MAKSSSSDRKAHNNRRKAGAIFDGDDTLWESQPLYIAAKIRFFREMSQIGFPQGQADKLLLLVGEKGEVVVPSNLANLVIFEYERKREGWQEEAIRWCAMCMAVARFAIATEKKEKAQGQ